MKNKAIEIIALILGLLTAIAGILTLPQVALLPQDWQPFVGLGLALVVVGKNAAYVVLDFSDDGQLNKSYKLPHGLPALLLCGLLLITLPSCATRADGTKTFAGLSKDDWALVAKDSGSAALKSGTQAGLMSYGTRRLTSAKDVTVVTP
jgi:hypothetical protein